MAGPERNLKQDQSSLRSSPGTGAAQSGRSASMMMDNALLPSNSSINSNGSSNGNIWQNQLPRLPQPQCSHFPNQQQQYYHTNYHHHNHNGNLFYNLPPGRGAVNPLPLAGHPHPYSTTPANAVASSTSTSTNTTASTSSSPPSYRGSTSPLRLKMSGRSAKRPADQSNGNLAKVKLPRMGTAPNDFSTVVKNRLSSYTRTGQACDRCKVRKIRCDADPDGCSHCSSQNMPCLVTDRVTGATQTRGYLKELEREKAIREARIRDLEQVLAETGIEFLPQDGPTYPPGVAIDSQGNIIQDPNSTPLWRQVGGTWIRHGTERHLYSNFPRQLLESRPEDSHLGLGGDKAPMSSLTGTELSILGMTVDLGKLEAPDSDEPPADAKASTPLYNKSTQAFLQSTMRINPPLQVELPSRAEAFSYCEMYFRTLYKYLPTLHEPTFMKLLGRIYDEPNFEPTVPQLVVVHMILATMFFQIGARNWKDVNQRKHLDDMSNKHYHYSLSRVYELRIARDLTSLQAMALIAAHARAFPKPGCASMAAAMALEHALSMNYHRESRKPDEPTNLQHEMRKRAWWAILTVSIAVTGRCGRPMPITVEEFDVGFPQPIADELITEDGVDSQQVKDCPYEIGLAGFKIIPIFMEMYSNIYCVRRDTQNYVNIVNALETQIRAWESGLSKNLSRTQVAPHEPTYLDALYARSFFLEFRLCLRHPSTFTGDNKEMMADNTRICEQVGREMLGVQQAIQRLNSLDTTWYQISVNIAAIFSMLAAHWERRENTTPEEVEQLKTEMNAWTSILQDIGNMIGSGPSISSELTHIMNSTVAWIARDMQRKTTQNESTDTKPPKQLPPNYSSFANPAVHNSTSQNDVTTKGFYPEQNIPYPQLGYGDQAQPNVAATYPPDAALFYPTSAQAAVAAAAATALPDQAPLMYPPHGSQVSMWPRGQNNSWHNWSSAITDPNQDRYSAAALMNLGAPRDDAGQQGNLPGPEVTSADIGGVSGQWPNMLFGNGNLSES